MAANRGAHIKKRSQLWREARTFVEDLAGFDSLVYLHGSSCTNDIGLTMTFAHELQHIIQYSAAPKLLAENMLVIETLRYLERSDFEALGLRMCDVPHEREARIVAKRVAESLHGVEAVRQYIDGRRRAFVTEQDAADWDCIQGLVASDGYDLAAETKAFFPKLNSCRVALERTLSALQTNDPEFGEIDLDALLNGAS